MDALIELVSNPGPYVEGLARNKLEVLGDLQQRLGLSLDVLKSLKAEGLHTFAELIGISAMHFSANCFFGTDGGENHVSITELELKIMPGKKVDPRTMARHPD